MVKRRHYSKCRKILISETNGFLYDMDNNIFF